MKHFHFIRSNSPVDHSLDLVMKYNVNLTFELVVAPSDGDEVSGRPLPCHGRPVDINKIEFLVSE